MRAPDSASEAVEDAEAPKPYLHRKMVVEAISALKRRKGSSQRAIPNYLEDRYKMGLPTNFKETLPKKLRKLTKAGKIVKVNNLFRLSDELTPGNAKASSPAVAPMLVDPAPAPEAVEDAEARGAAPPPQAAPATPPTGRNLKTTPNLETAT